jgi:hypothetical protein
MSLHPDLAVRVLALERSVRRTRALLAVAGVALLAVTLLAARPGPSRDPISATEFRLVDGKGELRGTFALDDGEHPTLMLLDRQGRKRWQALLKDDEVYTYMRDAEGHGRITHAIDRARHPHFLMHDKGNKPRLHAAVADSGAPSVLFIHVDGTMPAGMGVHADGRGWSLPAKPTRPDEPTRGEGSDKK